MHPPSVVWSSCAKEVVPLWVTEASGGRGFLPPSDFQGIIHWPPACVKLYCYFWALLLVLISSTTHFMSVTAWPPILYSPNSTWPTCTVNAKQCMALPHLLPGLRQLVRFQMILLAMMLVLLSSSQNEKNVGFHLAHLVFWLVAFYLQCPARKAAIELWRHVRTMCSGDIWFCPVVDYQTPRLALKELREGLCKRIRNVPHYLLLLIYKLLTSYDV